jgi:hypothetical protein
MRSSEIAPFRERLRLRGLPSDWATGLSALGSELAVAAGLIARHWQFWFVLALAAAVMMTMQNSVPLWYGGSDHGDYYWYARYLLEDRTYPLPRNWRTPGMGLFHIGSGTVLLDTWKGFIALFALFSVAIPVLFYSIVRPHSRNLALVAGLIIILSMTSYMYATEAGSDHVYFFLHALVLLMCVNYFRRPWDQRLAPVIAIALVAAFANAVRPVGAIIFWIFIGVAALLRPRDWRRLSIACAVYVALMMVWVAWDREHGTNGGLGPGLGYPLANELSTRAERRFAEAYFSQHGLVHARGSDAALEYPASRALRTALENGLGNAPNWQVNTFFTPHSLFGRYAEDTDGSAKLLEALFSDRNTLYFGFIVAMAQRSLGREKGLSLLEEVAAEHGTTGLLGWINHVSTAPVRLMLGVTPNLGGRNLFGAFFRARELQDRLFGLSYIPHQILAPDLGPATARMLAIVRQVIHDYPERWPAQIAADFRDRPQELFEAVIRDDFGFLSRGVVSEQWIYDILNWYCGPALAGQLYAGAAREILQRYPMLLLVQLHNVVTLTGMLHLHELLTRPFGREALALRSDAYFETRRQFTADLTPGLIRGLVPVVSTNEVVKTAAASQIFIYDLAPVFIVLLLIALPFLRSPFLVAPCLFLLLDYAYQFASIAVFTPWGSPRYEASFYLLPLIISCMILGEVLSTRSRKRVPL